MRSAGDLILNAFEHEWLKGKAKRSGCTPLELARELVRLCFQEEVDGGAVTVHPPASKKKPWLVKFVGSPPEEGGRQS